MASFRSTLRRLMGFADGLEAGRYSRRLSKWTPTQAHINTLISSTGKTTLARARYLVRNNGYAAGAVECFASNFVGSGILPSWILPDRVAEKKAIQETWKRWTDEADAEGLTDLYGIMRRIGRELFIAGEIFIRRRNRFLSDGLSVPVQFQCLPSEMLPLEKTEDMPNGNRIRQGIEFDKIGRRVAYHFWRSHPGDSTDKPQMGDTVRVPAEQILHVFDPVEAGQIRGLPRLTPVIVPLWMLDTYDDAEQERKRTAALLSVFVKTPAPSPQSVIANVTDTAVSVDDGSSNNERVAPNLQPGTAHLLWPGEEIQVAAPADVGPNYEAFQYRSLTRICSALGLPYAGVTGDMVRANYANQRAALIEMRRRMDALQYGVMVFQFCRPAAMAFLDAAVLAGTLSLDGYADNPAQFQNINWIAPRWEWVDPLKDRQAQLLAINSRTMAPSRAIEQEGLDPDEEYDRMAEDYKKMADKGIPMPVSDIGALQVEQPAQQNVDGDQPNNSDSDNRRPPQQANGLMDPGAQRRTLIN